MKISTVQQMREMDRKAVQQYFIPELLLMENAGLSAVEFLKTKLPLSNRKILVICGPGNNGGDGFVIARLLHSDKCQVTVLVLADPNNYQGSSRTNFQILQQIGVQCLVVHTDADFTSSLKNADVVVDAIFGTGLARPPEGVYAQVIDSMNASGKPIISIDIPSGIHGDSGQVMGSAVKATWTVTFGLPKTGTLLYPGYENVGELFISHISFPPALYEDPQIKCEINLPPPLPPRRPDGHKGTFGQALFIAGAQNYYGAPFFSAQSFLKAGGGYSRLACPRSIAPFIAAQGSEIVFVPQEETMEGSLAYQNLSRLIELSNQSDFVVLGPGISLQAETQKLILDLITNIQKPLLIDGDGLTALSDHLSLLTSRTDPVVLTPHPGEMSRLLDGNTVLIKTQPIETAREFSKRWNVILVLKGAHTLIANPDGNVYVNLTGNSGMGTAGSGDVLTGTIAAMFGLGLEINDAVRKGVFIHGFAGDLAAQKLGMDGMTASDIMEALPSAILKERSGNLMDFYPNFPGSSPIPDNHIIL